MGDVEKVVHAVFSPATFVADEAFAAPGRRQARIAKDQATIQRRAQAVEGAAKERERQLAVREQARQERIRRAQVMSAAEASGVSGSSVEASTIGAGQTLGAAGQAFGAGMTISNQQISSLQQQFANLQSESLEVAAQGQMFQTGVQLGLSALTGIGGTTPIAINRQGQSAALLDNAAFVKNM